MPDTREITLQLVHTTPEQIDLIRNLYQYYAYESSDWEQEDVEIDGRFYIHDEHLARYWQTPDWSANLLLVDGFIAGFLLIERSELPGLDALELADLFILKKYRRQGIGQAVARQTLLDPAHAWLVRFYRDDAAAKAFWESVLQGVPRTVKAIEPGDDPELITYHVLRVTH